MNDLCRLLRRLPGFAKVSVDLGYGAFRIGKGRICFFSNILYLVPDSGELVDGLDDGRALGCLRNIGNVLCRILGGIPGPVQFLNEILQGLAVVHRIQRIRKLPYVRFPSGGRFPDFFNRRFELVGGGRTVFNGGYQLAPKDVRVIVHLGSRRGKQLFQPGRIGG